MKNKNFPVVTGAFGYSGKYIAQLAIEQGAQSENRVINAIGPETFPYRDVVRTVANLPSSTCQTHETLTY